MTSEVFIENKRLDISDGLSNLLTYALDDIKDIGSRNTSFSKTIILPGTRNNNILFGHIFDVRISNSFNASGENVATNFNPAVTAKCLIFQNHIQIFKGTIRLMEIVITDGVPEYECAAVGELGGFATILGSGKLEDLDFSIYDHSFSAAGIIASWDNTPGSGYYYPLVDRGLVSTNKVDYDVKAFRPALYVKEYIDKIFTAANFTYECALFQTDRFKRLVIPHISKDFKRPATFILDVTDTSQHYINTDGTYWAVEFPSQATVQDFTIDINDEIFTYTGASPFYGDVTLTISGTFTKNVLTPFTVQLGINAATVGSALIGDGQLSGSFSVSIPLTTTLVSGDYIQAFVLQPTGGTVWDLVMFPHLTARSFADYPVDIVIGAQININDQLPKNIPQVDFFSSILKLFNLYVYDDKFTAKKLLIAPYVDFYDLNVSGITDWTYKMDRSKPIRLKPMSELNNRFYDFKFKPDTDYYNETYKKKYNQSYGDLLYDSGYQFVKDRQSVEVIFSPSVLVGYTGVDKIVPVFYKLSGTTEQAMDVNIRIFQTKKITGVTSWNLKDGVSVLTSSTDYGYGGHYDDPDAPGNDIQFGVPAELYFTLASGAINVTQFNVYWSSYMAEITDKDSKLLTAYFKLTAADIYNLDFSKLIYVDGSYWRLNKIEDWNASEQDVCKVELLKVINTVY